MTKTMNHVMLDLETFGAGPRAAVVSIGACLFDPVRGIVPERDDVVVPIREDSPAAPATFHRRVDLVASEPDHVGVIDPGTVEWWLRQSDEARALLVEEPRLPLGDALHAFTSWLGLHFNSGDLSRYDTDVRLWSNGPTFDEVILRAAYDRCGLKFPIHHRASRCCRTAIDFATAAGMTKADLPPREGIRHDALGDAVYQARGLCAVYERLGLARGH